jgi:hypothetical protein
MYEGPNDAFLLTVLFLIEPVIIALLVLGLDGRRQ